MPKVSKRTYPAIDPESGQPIKRLTENYFGQFYDADGIRQRVKLCSDKTASQTMLNDMVRKSRHRKVGLVDAFDEHMLRPLREHLADFRRHLEAKNSSPKHTDKTVAYVEKIKAAYSKRRRTDTRPVRSDLAQLLTPFLAALKAEAETTPSEIISFRAVRDADPSVWPGSWAEKAAVMLRADLEAAELPYEDSAGRVLAIHSRRHALRHTFGTNLAKAGVAPKIAQELMRHSDINLTMMTYSHVGLYDLDAALDSLPALPNLEAVSMLATGTTSEPGAVAHNWPPFPEIRCETVRADENRSAISFAAAESEPEMPKPLQLQRFEGDCEPLRLTEKEGRRSDLNRRPTLYESVCLSL